MNTDLAASDLNDSTRRRKDTTMKLKTLAFALALFAPVAAQAAEPAPAPKKECCCCEKGADGKMKCCDKMKAGEHAGDGMSGMDHK